MNILSNVPGLKQLTGGPALSKDEAEAEQIAIDELEAKKDRIAFHRTSVRNGPVSYKMPTNGQLRRERKRALARETKKARRRQVQQHFANRWAAAVARSQG